MWPNRTLGMVHTVSRHTTSRLDHGKLGKQCSPALGASLLGSTLCMLLFAQQSAATRVQISHNKSLDGVLDQLNSRHVTEAGPADLLDDAASDEDEGVLPATGAGEHAMQSSQQSTPTSEDEVYRPLLVQHDLRLNTSMSMPAALPVLCPRFAWMLHMQRAISRLLPVGKAQACRTARWQQRPCRRAGLPSKS